MSATLSDAQVGELLELTQHADTVELKLTIDEPHQRSALHALEIDPLDAQIRQVYFFDSPTWPSATPASSCAPAAYRATHRPA
jgi:hypothetical protein